MGELGLDFEAANPDVVEDEESRDPVVRVEGNAERKARSAFPTPFPLKSEFTNRSSR